MNVFWCQDHVVQKSSQSFKNFCTSLFKTLLLDSYPNHYLKVVIKERVRMLPEPGVVSFVGFLLWDLYGQNQRFVRQ